MPSDKETTFASTDKLGFKAFADRLESFMRTEQHFVEGSLVISLNTPFGSGKSTFLKMWQADLLERRALDGSLPLPVVLNAWESDYCGDPLLAIVSELTRAIEKELPQKDSENKVSKIREAAKDVGWFGAGLAHGFAANLLGINVIEAGAFAEARKERRTVTAKSWDALETYENRMLALTKLRHALGEFFGTEVASAYVLVDELDRCRPTYAVEYLETIKHVFNIRGLSFVLAVDKHQLRCSTQALYGPEMNFDEYYRKFAHRNVPLPGPASENSKELILGYVERYINDEDRLRPSLVKAVPWTNVADLVHALDLTPRQIQEMFRIVAHLGETDSHSDRRLMPGMSLGIIFMAALSQRFQSLYREMGSERMKIDNLCKFLLGLTMKCHDRQWWAGILLCGLWDSSNKNYWQEIVPSAIELGIISDHDEEELRRQISHFSRDWGHFSDPPFPRIFHRIETLKQFGQ